MLIVGGSNIILNDVANTGSQYFDFGRILLYSPWTMQDTRPWIVDAPLTLIWGGSDIVNNNIANTGRRYFDDGLMLLYSPWIMQDIRPEIVDALLTLIFRM